jgi:hypothetical protein
MAGAATLAIRDQLLAPLGGILADVDLWCPDQQDPVGRDPGWRPNGVDISHPDPLRYIVWVLAGHRGAPGELAPRKALHVGLRPPRHPLITNMRPGVHDRDGCRR